MKILATSINRADPSSWLTAEMQRMADLQRDGVVERFFLKADRSGAVLLLEALDPEAARSAVDTLPLVVNGVTEFTYIALVDPADLVGQ